VPMRHASPGFSPEATYSSSWLRCVIGVSATWLGLDKGGSLDEGMRTRGGRSPPRGLAL